ncbi:S-adenosylmethionine:diacylglycerol 3-amino-3-carboxypropyl transferase-like protein [Pirellula staleyi DSM 6068]|uniref:S-adenosylmethionine:diacylglycerol 3-amino-3-carboxypropyl transferase-like protein n=1 Tax=Pirellula staleyi (strain ATCC 27377 / DSM 6068 / ICPB 4128) TaxID=530564 RepID=D2QZP2_PIRSD|nr:BtaA family protein [Pirellula staleyi]ADB16525.1 S-adenosylmethionine:diacylglycerol 3-amino-3-carboxypropyl transferase-like protein [Pirellula staleyi DSM 6068]
MSVLDWVSGRVFKFVHGNNLVYNTCWEDPRLDRVALELKPTDNVLVITSAGCNALDYALCSPNHVYAVDMNPRQNALLDMKRAAIKSLDFEDFFLMFGEGYHPRIRQLYKEKIRKELPAWSQTWWDKWIKFFADPNRPFYFRGTSGAFARIIKLYTDRIIRVRPHIEAALDAKSIEEQVEIYEKHLRDKFWSRPMRFAMGRDTTLSMVGVPKAQRRQVEQQYKGGIVKFVQDSVEAVFCKLPLADNYFWRVYMKGRYTKECCPEYLKAENFAKLKGGLVDRVSTHTDSVQGFLDKHEGQISRYILLDHMDWLSDKFFPLLELEWQAILKRAATDTRILWRSGGLKTDFLDRVNLNVNGQSRMLPELLTHHEKLAAELHEKDRVHTYGSFYIADLKV